VNLDYEAVLSEAEQILDDVDRALALIDDGTYGVCDACGVRIAESRLEEFPTARTCEMHPQLTDWTS
jgi:RNA polymerase-binding transcription factor DksA